ncbi:MAG TPA: S41 family peptidase [Vicinamibacterales bacterium]
MAKRTRTRKRAKPARRSTTTGATMTLDQFLATTGTLSTAARSRLVDQAEMMFRSMYVHLPLKRAMHATDPVQRLRLLRLHLRALTERQFHDELIDIFTDIRDLHTNYILPAPYASKTAFLPFLLEEFTQDGERKYLVSKMLLGFTHPTFKPGVIATTWSGVPIDRAVDLNAEQQAGSNPDARHARGLEALTIRTMAMSTPPEEHWVIVGYLDGKTRRELRLDWRVFEPDPGPAARSVVAGSRELRSSRLSMGLDLRTELARRAKKILFNPSAMVAERASMARHTAGSRMHVNLADTSTMPDAFAFRSVTTPSGIYGYIRIWTFMVNDEDAFVAEFVRMAGLLPQNGLIVDVRGNGGGNIFCAEKLLQVLTPRPVEPTLLSFINSELTLEICKRNDWVASWAPSIEESVETGEIYSQGFSLEPFEFYNHIGQRYQGPVLLITDPLCYSATDIFSAGFQDNQIGPILSVGGRTGAGGANVWDYDLLQQVLPGRKNPFRPLPQGASFRVAARRVVRSGTHRGVPLEDLGVSPDKTHDMTKADLLNDNRDLLAKAGRLLATLPRPTLNLQVTALPGGTSRVTLITKGLDRVDITVDGRPRATVDVTGGTVTAEIPQPGAGEHEVAAHGFKAGVLTAVASVTM